MAASGALGACGLANRAFRPKTSSAFLSYLKPCQAPRMDTRPCAVTCTRHVAEGGAMVHKIEGPGDPVLLRVSPGSRESRISLT